MKTILYLTRNGLLEPLGQSQILSYLMSLGKTYRIIIISFEKAEDVENTRLKKEIEDKIELGHLEWFPLKYRRGKAGIILGFVDLFKHSHLLITKRDVDIIHARSYFVSFLTLLLSRWHGIPFIFDMRALWPEELVEAGRLQKNSLSWVLIKHFEKRCLASASSVVSLTHSALNYLKNLHPELLLEEKTVVIPTCADLNRFKFVDRTGNKEIIKLCCVGSMLTGWFNIEMLKKVMVYILSKHDNVQFELITRDNSSILLSELGLENHKRVKVFSSSFSEMPMHLAKHDGSLFFFSADVSKMGSAPTRMAELLGTGIPVLANAGVGDVGSIVINNEVGVIIPALDDDKIESACDQFIKLTSDNSIRFNCREAAEAIFSLEAGVLQYAKLYDLLG